jgi:hypothetical protein
MTTCPSPDKPHVIPTSPPFGLPPDEYGPALDRWLASLVRCCDDPEWVEEYRQGVMGEPPPVETRLDHYPSRGDAKAWDRWWKTYNEVFAEAGASADGLEYDTPAPRQPSWECRVADVVRQVLAEELPAALEILSRTTP